MHAESSLAFQSNCQFKVTRRSEPTPQSGVRMRWWNLKQFFQNRLREIPLLMLIGLIWAWRKLGLPSMIPGFVLVYGTLRVRVFRADGSVEDYGVVGRHLITTAGKGFLVDAWQGSVEPEIMKYHGVGTGTTAANVADTALETELTTQYNPDSTRATGTLTEGASANIFKTVGVNTFDAAVALTEWGLLSQAATGGGVLFDRQVFSVINLGSSDSLSSSYEATVG